MFESNERCEYCANYYRHPDAGCGSCVNGNNYIDSDFVPLPSFSLTGTIVIGNYDIKNVIFNPPATIVFWADGTKTVVKAHGEEFDPEKGLAMAISKKALGTGYYPEIKKWTKKCHKKNEDDKSSAWEEWKKKLDKAMNKVADAMKETVNMADTIRSEITMSEEVWNNVLQRALIDADEDDAESDAYYKSVICPECIAKMEDE